MPVLDRWRRTTAALLATLALVEICWELWLAPLKPGGSWLALKARFPAIAGPKKDDICYATQNRQDAVKFMAKRCDLVIVVGSPNSSNSNRLREVAANLGIQAHMIDRAEELQTAWLEGRRCVGVTAGASAPDVLVRQVIERLKALGASGIVELGGVVETTVFPMPKGLATRTTTELL